MVSIFGKMQEKMQEAAWKAMSRAQVDALGDSPKEREIKEYWYSVHADEVKMADTPNNARLERLDAYASVPRSTDTPFITDVAGKPPLMGSKDKWLEQFSTAPLLYGAVVQAHHALFKSGNNQKLGVVIVVSLDSGHRRDRAYLGEVAAKIAKMKTAADVPADMKPLIKTLQNDNSYFCFKVGSSVAGDNDTWCATLTIEQQSDLPMNRIVEERIIPILLKEAPQENRFLPAALIPGKYYN